MPNICASASLGSASRSRVKPAILPPKCPQPGAGKGGWRHAEDSADAAEHQVAACHLRAIAVKPEPLAVKGRRDHVPLSRTQRCRRFQAVAFAAPENQFARSYTQVARILVFRFSETRDQHGLRGNLIGVHPGVERPGRIGQQHGVILGELLIHTFTVGQEDAVVRPIERRIIGDLGARRCSKTKKTDGHTK